jgi:hypothetical protein
VRVREKVKVQASIPLLSLRIFLDK